MPLYIHQPPSLFGVLFGLLLVAALAALIAAGLELARNLEAAASWRLGVLVGMTLWGAALVAVTELLSLVHQLSPLPLAVAWLVVAGIGAGGWWRLRRARGPEPPAAPGIRPPMTAWLLPAAMAVLAAVQAGWIAITAFTYAPNNYDALTYHLPRVLRWLQQQSSGPFATNTERQVQFPPLAEYAVTQLHLVSPDDSLVNFEQWFGMLVAALAVSEIARRLGAGRNAQYGAALLTLALPIGIAEAATTQNDFVVAAWLAAFTAIGLGLAANPGSRPWALLTGLALGLALLTKSTAYIYAVPIVALIAGIAIRRRDSWPRAALRGGIAAAAALGLNAALYLREYRTYHSPLGPTGAYHNEVFTPAALASNVIRNVALQVPMGGPLEPLGRALQSALAWLNSLTGFGPLDPRITFPASFDVFHQVFAYGPDFGGNLVQTLLIVATLAALAWSGSDRIAKLYAAALLAAFLLFSGYLKFQIWGNRLELPLLVLWSPAVAAVLFHGRERLGALVPLLVLVVSFAWTLNSADAPPGDGAGLSRTDYYARQATQPEYAAYKILAVDAIGSGCSAIGLSFAGDNVAEYPLWAMLQEGGFKGRVEHVDVNNPTARWAEAGFHPCAVIADHSEPRYASSSVIRQSGGYWIYEGLPAASS